LCVEILKKNRMFRELPLSFGFETTDPNPKEKDASVWKRPSKAFGQPFGEEEGN
jgi:hypothetical protein